MGSGHRARAGLNSVKPVNLTRLFTAGPFARAHVSLASRFQFRVRTLLLAPVILALSWWLAVQKIEMDIRSEDYQQIALLHEQEAVSYQQFVESPIPDQYVYGWGYVTSSGQSWSLYTGRTRPLTEAERMNAKRDRERAGRRVAYHRALTRKYSWAARFPWFPIATDAPEPD
jgi:hypothetical protein